MPLFTNTPKTIANIPLSTVVPTPDSASVYSEIPNPSVSVPYIEGNVWSATYYALHSGLDDPAINSADIADPSLKHYTKIANYEVRVTNPLSSSTDANNIVTVTGSANVYPYIKPSIGDVFIASIELGSIGIFEVTSVERMSMYQGAVWGISYTLKEYALAPAVTALDSFVVLDLVFDLNLLGSTRGPLRTISDNNQSITAVDIKKNLIEMYYELFYSPRWSTFLRPADTKVYDDFIVDFWNMFIESDGCANPVSYDFRNTKLLRGHKTIFDVIADCNYSLLARVPNRMRITSVSSVSADLSNRGLIHSGLSGIVFPNVINGRVVDDPINDFYVFSENFYTNSAILTPIESLVMQYLQHQSIPFSKIVSINDSINTWSDIDKFYHIPILLCMLTMGR